MTSRRWPLVANAVVVVALAGADRWLVDSGGGAVAIAVVVLTPPVAWVFAAPTWAWAWSVSVLLQGVLFTSLWASRVPFSSGPVAPPVDWLLPYLAGAVVVITLALTVCRRWPWKSATALVALVIAASCWGLVEWMSEGEAGGHAGYLPASEAAPWASGVVIAGSGRGRCSQNGALCDRQVYVRTTLTPAEIRETLRSHGWREECQPVTGILSHLDLYRYGHRCLSVSDGGNHGAGNHGVVVVGLLGQADWWYEFRTDPDPLG